MSDGRAMAEMTKDVVARGACAVQTSTEVVVFDLLGRAGTEDFKVPSKLIK